MLEKQTDGNAIVTDLTEPAARPRVVVIGGGFAGTALVQNLERRLPDHWDIYLLSESNFVTFNPLLPEVIGASLLPGHVLAPIRLMIRRARIRMVCVDDVDFDAKVIAYHNNEASRLKYDHLVFASGVRANTDIIPGMKHAGLPLKTVGDALFIRNRVIERLEQATIHPNPTRRQQLTTYVVVGGGFSGVEVAGELDDFLVSAQRYYKNVQREDCRVILIHGGDRLLPELSESLGRKTEQIFSKRGIDVRLNAKVTAIDDEHVMLADGEVIAAATIICTVGNKPNRYTSESRLPVSRGKIETRGDMSVTGIENVWALGDCALVPNAYNNALSPPTAQFADRQGRQLARNIVAAINGEPTRPFYYRPAGMLASIGHNKAVAEIYGVQITGFIAWLIWRGIYLLKMPTFARKMRLFLEWNWAMLFPPDIAHLGFSRSDDTAPYDVTSTSRVTPQRKLT